MEKFLNEKYIKYIQIGLFFIGIVWFLISYVSNLHTQMFLAILLVFLSNCIYCLLDIYKRAMLLLFHGAFFVFLMGRMVMDLITSQIVKFNFNLVIGKHILLALFLSLVFLIIGYYIIDYFFKRPNNEQCVDSKYKLDIRRICKYLYYVGFAITILFILEQAIFVSTNSYLDFYTKFESQIPSVFRILANTRNTTFFIFLATFPSKKECKIPLLLFLLEGILSLSFGDRGSIATGFMFIAFYFFLRHGMCVEEKWIKWKYVLIICVIMPFILAFLSFFVFIREGMDTDGVTIFNQFIRFFNSLGRSVDVIGYGKVYDTELPNKIYTIGELVEYVKYNPITEFLFGNNLPAQYTKEYAMNGHSFMHTISYFINPDNYLAGHGSGSSYVAEAYHDFGYLGIALINLLFGGVISIFNKVYNKNIFLTAAFFIMFHIMFYIPRGASSYIITYVINLTSLFAVLLIFFILFLLKKRKKYKNG